MPPALVPSHRAVHRAASAMQAMLHTMADTSGLVTAGTKDFSS